MNLLAPFLATILLAAPGETPANLIRNSDFRDADENGSPAEWTPWAPLCESASCRLRQLPEGGLQVDAPAEPYSVGGVWQDLGGIEPGQAYAVHAACTFEQLASPMRSVLLRVNWLQGRRLLHPAGYLVRGPRVAEAQASFDDVFVAPDMADGLRITLEVKWPGKGAVVWREVGVRPTDPPKPRNVKVGTVYLRPQNSTPERNLDLWCEQIAEAGRLGLDIVCLCEAITMVGTPRTALECAKPVPGAVTERLGAAARKGRLWVVAGILERDGSRVYNTAVLLDRQGRLAGKYRKVHLPREEWQKGIIPGDAYPVFETDFGTIAIQICYDWFFPEAAAMFARNGAEMLFAPTWGNTLPDAEGRVDGESTFRVRARDNGLYLVPSVYDGSSMVIDPLGRILVSSAGGSGVFWCEVDLSRRERLRWVGHWGSIGPRDRMPSTYGPLAEPAE